MPNDTPVRLSKDAAEELEGFFGPLSGGIKKGCAIRSMSFLDNDDIYNACLVNFGWSDLAMDSALWEKKNTS